VRDELVRASHSLAEVVLVGNQQVGRLGEDAAVTFLAAQQYVILDRNWRCRAGEIDIVAKEGDNLVFVEVKARSSLRFGHPFEAVTPTKLARLRSLSVLWRDAHPLTTGSSRIDVISVVLPGSRLGLGVGAGAGAGAVVGAASPQIEHLRGVHA
jgi:putative endonuclease